MIILLPTLPKYYPYDRAMMGNLVTPSYGGSLRAAATAPLWAADNGCFTLGDKFDFDVFKRWLDRLTPHRDTCKFVTVPDVVSNAQATAERWQEYASMLDGWPLAYVAQDGMEALPAVEFAALFIGGSTDWKKGPIAKRLTKEAKAAGKWVHMGRVNSQERILYAFKIGVDSFDGTGIAFAPNQRLREQVPYLRALRNQTSMFDGI